MAKQIALEMTGHKDASPFSAFIRIVDSGENRASAHDPFTQKSAMNSHTTVAQDPAMRRMLDEAVDSVQAAEGSILLLGDSGGVLCFALSRSPVAEKLAALRVPLGEGITGLSVSLQQPMIVNETRVNPAFYRGVDEATGAVTRSIMVVPLSTPAQEFGALTAINSSDAAGFDSADLERYVDYAGRIAERLTELNLGMEHVGAFE